jgi:hypothetical protein
MSICDLITGAKRLQKASKILKERWGQTKEHWRDATAEQFEEQYLRPLGEKVQLALGAVDRLSEVLQRAEKELQDRGS